MARETFPSPKSAREAVRGLLDPKVDLGELIVRFGMAARVLAEDEQVSPFFRNFGFSGYDFRFRDGFVGEIAFAPLLDGGFVVRRTVDGETRWVRYSQAGEPLGESQQQPGEIQFVNLTRMEPGSPVLDHLYNLLHHEYQRAQGGDMRTTQVRLVETVLRRLARGSPSPLSVKRGVRDPAILDLRRRVLEREADSVLLWRERQRVFNRFHGQIDEIASTKARAHRLSRLTYGWVLMLQGMCFFFLRVLSRPRSNALGILRLCTLDAVLWFFRTVRNNIGYSIALAIYGPFTFYFITQPLNPKAMWAVGKVREAYLDTTEAVAAMLARVGVADSAAIVRREEPTEEPTPAPVDSGTATKAPPPDVVRMQWTKELAQAKPRHLDFLLSTDIDSVDRQDWDDRMSNFKALQIAFEENMVFAARMGRVEQLETQLTFPLIVRSAWFEIDRYREQLAQLRNQQSLPRELREFVEHEEHRANRALLYCWDRLVRFNRDYLYIVTDANREHTYRDKYMAESLLLLEDLTRTLDQRHKGFAQPQDLDLVHKLAARYREKKNSPRSMLERLAANSSLFAQKDRFDGWELRAYMKRQWEILFLLQNKAQEASNFGLMAYTASVRTALWVTQAFYAVKRRELEALASTQQGSEEQRRTEIARTLEPQYESLFHLLNIDLISIQPELQGRLTRDIDWVQRRALIKDYEEFLTERERLSEAQVLLAWRASQAAAQ